MKNKPAKKGSTLVEVLVSFAILATTGVFILGFLYKNSMTNKVWVDDYGQELSKIALYSIPIKKDTVIEHVDANGVPWNTIVKVSKEDFETCFKAVSVRHETDTTRALYYCKYGDNK